MQLPKLQYQLFEYMANLGPVGSSIEVVAKDVRSFMTGHAYATGIQAFLRTGLIKQIDETHFIVQEDPSKVTTSARSATSLEVLGVTLERLLATLTKNYALEREIRIPVDKLSDETGLRNLNNLKGKMFKLHELGAIEIQLYSERVYTLTIKRRVEEFVSAAPRTKKESNSRSEHKILLDKIDNLTQLLHQAHMQKPTAWLWKPKSSDTWKDVTLEPPSKEDMKTLDFHPLYTNTQLFEGADYPVYTHLKTGNDYQVLGEFHWEETMELSTLYRSMKVGQKFGRVSEIFHDGRFKLKRKP